MNHTLTTIAATILTLVLAAPASADIPLATDNAITAASGNRANGFTLTFAGGGTWHTDPFHTELATCRADYAKGPSRKKCTAIVRASMREYVALRAAAKANQ